MSAFCSPLLFGYRLSVQSLQTIQYNLGLRDDAAVVRLLLLDVRKPHGKTSQAAKQEIFEYPMQQEERTCKVLKQ